MGNVIRQVKAISEVLEMFQQKQERYVPNNDSIFTVFYYIKPRDIKVVLIGQDPYVKLTCTGEPEAQGMSFSLPLHHTINPSLKNIYKELSEDVELTPQFNIPDHGCLIEWVKRGVLLLNVHQTTVLEKPKGHSNYGFWNQFTVPLLENLVANDSKLIFILLGAEARGVKMYLKNKGTIIEAGHPSTKNINGGFLGSKVFSKCNSELIKQGHEPIDWNISSKEIVRNLL